MVGEGPRTPRGLAQAARKFPRKILQMGAHLRRGSHYHDQGPPFVEAGLLSVRTGNLPHAGGHRAVKSFPKNPPLHFPNRNPRVSSRTSVHEAAESGECPGFLKVVVPIPLGHEVRATAGTWPSGVRGREPTGLAPREGHGTRDPALGQQPQAPGEEKAASGSPGAVPGPVRVCGDAGGR